MGILKGFKDSRVVMRAPRSQLNCEALRTQFAQQSLITSASMATSPMVTETVAGFMPRPTRTGGGDAPSDDALAPVEGVTLDRYASIVRGIAAYNSDQSMLAGIAIDQGIDVDTWHRVHQGWNARIRANPAVARRFSDIYHA
ncbi:MAG: hypothetical protein JWN99_769 [Ilumatobacteraceae bacterium]|nr:hypothetical protein [Ilumatobacteraceae bacterium]